MLHEIAASGAVLARIGLELAYGVPLMEAREDNPSARLLLRRRAAVGANDVNEPRKKVKPGVPRPNLLPQIGRTVADRVERVPSAALLGAAVEGQELRRLTCEFRRH